MLMFITAIKFDAKTQKRNRQNTAVRDQMADALAKRDLPACYNWNNDNQPNDCNNRKRVEQN